MINKALSVPLLLLSFAIGGCGNSNDVDAKPDSPPAAKVQVMNVKILTLEPQDLEENFVLPANLEAWEDLTLAAEQAGAIRWVGPKEGDRISKGEEILKIDPETLEASLARDRAELERQKGHLDRLRRLVEKRLVSQQEYEDGRLAFEVARAQFKLSEVALNKSVLKSPVDGVLDDLLVDRGEYVGVGDPMAVLVQVDRLKALIDVPEKDVSFLKGGQRVKLVLASTDGRDGPERDGEIIHLAYKADPMTRTYRAKIGVDNRDGAMRPGMIVRAQFLRRKFTNAVAVPLYALIDYEGEKVVYVAEGDVARRVIVRPEAVLGEQVVISQGLSAGERLIVKGQHVLNDGAAIAVREE